MEKSVLKIEHLKKFYHDQNGEIEAIKDIDLDIYDKEVIPHHYLIKILCAAL